MVNFASSYRMITKLQMKLRSDRIEKDITHANGFIITTKMLNLHSGLHEPLRQKSIFSIFFSWCEQICCYKQIRSLTLQKSLKENFLFLFIYFFGEGSIRLWLPASIVKSRSTDLIIADLRDSNYVSLIKNHLSLWTFLNSASRKRFTFATQFNNIILDHAGESFFLSYCQECYSNNSIFSANKYLKFAGLLGTFSKKCAAFFGVFFLVLFSSTLFWNFKKMTRRSVRFQREGTVLGNKEHLFDTLIASFLTSPKYFKQHPID